MSLLSRFISRSPVDLGSSLRAYRPLTTHIDVAWMELLHTPGHTPGHVSLYRPEDRTLLVEIAFAPPSRSRFFEAALAQHAELHGPPSYFTSDWAQARQSVQKLARIDAGDGCSWAWKLRLRCRPSSGATKTRGGVRSRDRGS